MDIKELKRKAQAAREFELPVGAATFTLRLPAEVEMSSMYAHASAAPGAQFDRLIRALTPSCVVAWRGVTQGELVPGLEEKEAAAPLACVPEAVEEYLIGRPGLFDTLTGEILTRYNKRQAEKAEASKN